jgi:predicted acyl esterase
MVSVLFLSAQQIFFEKTLYKDSVAIENNMPLLAGKLITLYHTNDKTSFYDNLFRLQIVAQQYDSAMHSLRLYELIIRDTNNAVNFPYKVYCATKKMANTTDFASNYKQEFKAKYNQLDFEDQELANYYFKNAPKNTLNSFDNKIKALSGKDSLSLADAVALCRSYCMYKVYSTETAIAGIALVELEHENYITDDSVLVQMPDGGKIALTVIRNRKITTPQPVVLMYDIYAGNDDDLCKQAVNKGYVGIVANTRGKRLSPDAIEPFEHDAKDAYHIIDWISKQSWCNGKVGMYGGSYLGFAQWSAVKYLHPALKTIVPQVSVGIGIDYPMENNVFRTDMLRWLHFVMDNKLTDWDDYNDNAKWNKVFNDWYKTGASFRSLDTMDGRPNAIFHRWLDHPGYDSYWKSMTPQREEFAKINIPILTTTGYWDDDQQGAMYYYNQYFKWNKNPDYYLVIGPYDHIGSQGYPKRYLEGYQPDSIALIKIKDLVFEWFDYILKGGKRPEILKDKVNFEVMGENKWHHVPSLNKMHNDSITFYLANIPDGMHYSLSGEKPKKHGYILQKVDLKERGTLPAIGEDIGAFDKILANLSIGLMP